MLSAGRVCAAAAGAGATVAAVAIAAVAFSVYRSVITVVGLLCIFFHLCWCCEGCLSDGSEHIEPNIEDMKATALKSR